MAVKYSMAEAMPREDVSLSRFRSISVIKTS